VGDAQAANGKPRPERLEVLPGLIGGPEQLKKKDMQMGIPRARQKSTT
jgi:hypothetical protein